MAVKKSAGWRGEVAKQMGTLQKRAEKGLDEALKMLPPAQRKTVKELTANVDRARAAFRKRADGLVKDVRKRAEGMMKDVNKRTEKVSARLQKRVEGAVSPLSKRAEGMLKDLGKRAEKVSAQAEKRVEGLVVPLTKRLDLASRRDVDKLRKRLDQLEKRMGSKARLTHTGPHSHSAVA